MWLSNTVQEVPVVHTRSEVRKLLQYHKGIRLHHTGSMFSCKQKVQEVIREDGFYDGVILVHNNTTQL